jgi:hypothetical protein
VRWRLWRPRAALVSRTGVVPVEGGVVTRPVHVPRVDGSRAPVVGTVAPAPGSRVPVVRLSVGVDRVVVTGDGGGRDPASNRVTEGGRT